MYEIVRSYNHRCPYISNWLNTMIENILTIFLVVFLQFKLAKLILPFIRYKVLFSLTFARPTLNSASVAVYMKCNHLSIYVFLGARWRFWMRMSGGVR